MMITSYQIPP